MLKPAALLAALLATGQITDSRTTPFGPVRLTEAERAQIASLASSTGRSPRLFLGLRTMMVGPIAMDVYLEPDVENGDVQRGRLLRIEATDPPMVPERTAWRLKETRSYACIALPSRRPFDVVSEQDLGWPFIVEGQFDDATLVSIVTFVRSQPRIERVRPGVLPQFVAQAPISAVFRRGEEIMVGLRTGELQGARATLGRKGAQWVITQYENWIQ